MIKNLPANTENKRDLGLIPELGGSPGGRHGNPLQYSCLEIMSIMSMGSWTEEPGGLQSLGSQSLKGIHAQIYHFFLLLLFISQIFFIGSYYFPSF